MNRSTMGWHVRRHGRLDSWRFMNTGHADPFFNMALDEAIARSVEAGQSPPTLRIYGWRPAAISIGYSQKAMDTVNLKECARQGIPVVRRLTGGRAVYHHQEVTYSLVAPKGYWGEQTSVVEIYRHIGQALVTSLGRLGVGARLSRATAQDVRRRRLPGRTPCFASAGRYEVMVGGRKVVGSAQRWLGDVVLQHGSVLLGEGHERIAELLPQERAGEGQWAAQRLAEKTATLAALRPGLLSFDEVARALGEGFGETLGCALQPAEPSAGEMATASCLVRQRYGCVEWTLFR